MLFTIFVLYYAATFLDFFKDYIHCSEITGGNLVCLGVSAVYRMSLALAILFFLMFLACLPRSEFSKKMNEGFWPMKILIIFALFFVFFLVSNSFFEGYSDFAKFMGLFFLVFQIIMLIDLFYLCGEKMKAYYDEGYQYCGPILIALAAILFIGNLLLTIFNFIWFSSDSGCGMNIFIIILNIIFTITQTGISVSGISKNGSLITAGLQSLYLTYLTWAGLSSNPDGKCNSFLASDTVMITSLVIGFLLILVTLIYLTFSSPEENTKNVVNGGRQKPEKNNLIDNKKNDSDNEEDDEEDEDDEEKKKKSDKNKQSLEQENNESNKKLKAYQTNQYIDFHLVMMVSSIYISMLLTNWGSPTIDSKSIDAFRPSSTSYWIQIIGSWIGSLLYIWTLVAPRILPNRQF
jgi:serine incorporator 1/3